MRTTTLGKVDTTFLAPDPVVLDRVTGVTRLADGEAAANKAAAEALAPKPGKVLPATLAIVLVTAIAYNVWRRRRG